MTSSPALIVNPSKTDDLPGLVEKVASACSRHGLAEPQVYETTEKDPGRGRAEEALAGGADLVLVAGGDGTVQAVGGALAGSDAHLGLLPLGTGNLLARNLGIPLGLDDAIDVAFGASDRRLDVGQARLDGGEPAGFLVMAGVGFDAQMMVDAPEKLKAAVGWPAYVVSGLKHLRDRPLGYEIAIDGASPVSCAARGVVVGNVGQLQAGVALLPDAEPDDGRLDVVVLAPDGLWHWAQVLTRLASRSDKQDASLRRATATTVEIRARQAVDAQLDGETLGTCRTMSIELQPAALSVRVPA